MSSSMIYDLELQHTGIIDSFYWISPVALSCQECMQPSVHIRETVVIGAVVFDENGCSRTVEVKIEYQRGVEYEMANVIHSNSVVNNNRLYLTVADPQDIYYDMCIYSRWGDQIYKSESIPANDPSYGWDGTKGGKRLNTGVYIYKIMIKENDVPLEVIHGDVTLID